jgi:ribosomal protein L12E/L44/L45/RPP1/RPP2
MGAFLLSLMVILSGACGGASGQKQDDQKQKEQTKDDQKQEEQKKDDQKKQ